MKATKMWKFGPSYVRTMPYYAEHPKSGDAKESEGQHEDPPCTWLTICRTRSYPIFRSWHVEVEVFRDSILLTDPGNVILIIVEASKIGPAEGQVEL